MIKAQSIGIGSSWYTPAQDESETPTRFKLKRLTPPEMEQVMEVGEDGGIGFHPKHNKLVLKLGIQDWENFDDPDTGTPIKCSFPNHTRIPLATRSELVGEIFVRSQLSEGEAKN